MKESRVNLIFLVLYSLFLLQSPIPAIFSLFIALGSLAAIVPSFWLRFFSIGVWILLVFFLCFFPEVFILTRGIYFISLLYEIIFLSRMWRNRKEKMVQPVFQVIDLIDTSNEKEPSSVPYSKLAVASMVMGALGIFFGPLTTIPALILGWIALRKIKKGQVKGKKFAYLGIVFFLAQMIFTLVVVGYAFYMGSKPESIAISGENAVKQMNKEELTFLNTTLKQITIDSTENDVIRILGKPRRWKQTILLTSYYYDCPYRPAPQCAIRVDFRSGKATRIGWTEEKRFMYITTLGKK